MRGGKSGSQGFTILEVIIALAIAVGFLAIAIYTFSGKQNQATFDQSVREAQSVIQKDISNVINGSESSQSNFTCSDSGTNTPPNIVSGSGSIGSNSGCVFLGTAINFQDPTASPTPSNFTKYSIVGRQCDIGLNTPSNCSPPVSIQNSDPIPLAPGTLAADSTSPDDSVTSTFGGGLTVNWIKDTSSPTVCGGGSHPGTIAFLTNPSNSQQLDLYVVCSSVLGNNNSPQMVDKIYNYFQNPRTPSTQAQICLSSSTTNQSGLLTISQGSGQLQTDLTIHTGNLTCS